MLTVMHESVSFTAPSLEMGILAKKILEIWCLTKNLVFHISLISDRVSFIWVVSCCISSFVNWLFVYFAHLTIWFLLFFLTYGFLYINPWSVASIFSQFFVCQGISVTHKKITIFSSQICRSFSLCLISSFAS